MKFSARLYKSEQRARLKIRNIAVLDGEKERYWPSLWAEPDGISHLAVLLRRMLENGLL